MNKSNFRRSFRVAIVAGFIAFSAIHCGAQTFYVSPGGSDVNPGTLARPFQTLAHARDAVRRFLPAMGGDITVYLRGGTYRLDRPIEFASADSGRNGHIVCYRNVPGEVPVLNGGAIIPGWKVHDSAKNIWQASVPPGASFRQLYVNGVKANMARSADSLGLAVQRGGFGYTSANPILRSLSHSLSVPDMDITTRWVGWVQAIVRVDSISDTGFVGIQPAGSPTDPGPQYRFCGNPVWLENAYELLAKPGDWCLQRASNTIYYIPRERENMVSAKVEIPSVDQLILLSGSRDNSVSNLRFAGLSCTEARWMFPAEGYGFITGQANQPECTLSEWTMKAAVDGAWMNNVDVSQCNFFNLGGNGVNILKGSRNAAVDHCVFHDLAGTAVQVACGWKPDGQATPNSLEIVDGVIVSNNTIHDVCDEYLGGCGIYVGYTRNCTIAHNTLYDLPYTGISLGWGWGEADFASGNFIDGNLIHDHMRVLNDGGAIYCNGIQRHATLSDNFAYNQGHPYGVLYLDDGGSNWSVFNNVIHKDSAASWYLYKGANNHSYNNFTDDAHVRAESPGGAPCTCSNNTVVTDGNWPPAAKAIMDAAGPTTGVYYTSRPDSIVIGGSKGNGDFSQGFWGWTAGGPLSSWGGVVAGLHPGEEMPPTNRSVAFHARGSDPGGTLECHFNAVAGHIFALSYSQAAMGAPNNQSLAVSVAEGTGVPFTLGTSTTWAPSLYARFVRTFTVTKTGIYTLRFADVTTAANGVKTDCVLDRVELRDVTPPSTGSGRRGAF